MSARVLAFTALVFLISACAEDIGARPEFSPATQDPERAAMLMSSYEVDDDLNQSTSGASSLWTGTRSSLLGDRRARQAGDILTVVIEIDDSAEISNSTDQSRSASQQAGISQLFGVPQRLDPRLPEGASMSTLVDLGTQSGLSGDGSVRRNEKLTLRIAATVVGAFPNGVLEIAGRQEVRVNNELRELLVSGHVRPEDISRQNEITYDKIAGARISYGGRGQISALQANRYGQIFLNSVLPF